jgi:ribosomal protein S13
MLILGGDWSAYWYNGHVYASEIARGLDIFELTPTKFLTQNEIDAAKTVRMADFNVQNQQRIEWPHQLIVARAYVDQLERTQALPADQIASLRKGISDAESLKMDEKSLAALRSLAEALEKNAATMKSATDSSRTQALAEILKQPEKR